MIGNGCWTATRDSYKYTVGEVVVREGEIPIWPGRWLRQRDGRWSGIVQTENTVHHPKYGRIRVVGEGGRATGVLLYMLHEHFAFCKTHSQKVTVLNIRFFRRLLCIIYEDIFLISCLRTMQTLAYIWDNPTRTKLSER